IRSADRYTLKPLRRHALEQCQARRNEDPIRLVACEDPDRRLEERRIVERPRVDRVAAGISHHAAVDEATTDRTGVAHGFASVLVLQGLHDDPNSDPHRVAGDADERDETRTGRLPAVGAETIAHEARLPPGFIAHCAA